MRYGVACALMLASAHAFAQPTAADVALAQSLFEDGTELMRRGNYREACPKLAESQRLDPGGGTLINLAVCLEKDNKYASAYLAYNEALAIAERDGNRSREARARDGIAAITPLVSRVVIKVAPESQALEGLEVHFDTASVRRAAWGVAAPIDMGQHVVTANAPGKREWRGVIAVDKPGALVEVQVPALDDQPQVAPPPAPLPVVVAPVEKPPPSTTQRTAGWITIGAGGAAAVIGIVTATVAAVRHADGGCKNGECPTPAGVIAERDANAFAWTANIAFGTAAVAVVAGAVLVLTAPQPSSHASVTPLVGPTFVGVRGVF